MTLQEFSDATSIDFSDSSLGNGTVSLLCPLGVAELWRMLYNLEDYRVSACSGPVVWLVPISARKIP